MEDHDRQYIIELDGNYPLDNIFQQLITKLETYSLRPAVVPLRLQGVEEESDIPDDLDTVRNLFFTLRNAFVLNCDCLFYFRKKCYVLLVHKKCLLQDIDGGIRNGESGVQLL